METPFSFSSLTPTVGRPRRELLVILAFQSNFPRSSMIPSSHRYKMYNEWQEKGDGVEEGKRKKVHIQTHGKRQEEGVAWDREEKREGEERERESFVTGVRNAYPREEREYHTRNHGVLEHGPCKKIRANDWSMAHPLHARGRAYVVLKCVGVTAAYTHLRSYVVRAPGIRKGVSILGRACYSPTREKEGLEVIRYPFFPFCLP